MRRPFGKSFESPLRGSMPGAAVFHGVPPAPAAVRNPARNTAIVWILAVLFWSIFYQNLPWHLDGFAAGGSPTINIGDRIIKLCMIGVGLYVIADRWRVARSVGGYLNIGLAGLSLLAILSAVWSIDRGATVMRFISLTAIMLVCFAATVADWHRLRFQTLVIPPLLFVLVGSLVVGMIYPDHIAEIGSDVSQKGAWHGITRGKNEFGMFASMGTIVFAQMWLAGYRHKWWALAGAVVGALCLLLSRSNTSQLATLVAVGFMVLVMRVPFIGRKLAGYVAIALASLLLLYQAALQSVIPGLNALLGPVARLMGKDTTFSSRTIIWDVIRQHIEAAPLLGSGYGAYWNPVESSPSWVFMYMNFFYPMEAHNSYLEIVNDLGLVGLVFLLAFVAVFVWQGVKLMRFDRPQAALYLAFLFQEMVINMSESEWLSRTSTFSMLLLAVFCLSRALRDAEKTRPLRRPKVR